jgi:3',5'-cyclic AMP phosphodiesterase CpdA
MRTVAHLSDLHFGRIDGAVLGPLRTAVVSARPDLIAISGDFTQRARRREFAAARAFLDTLEPPKLLVPGNHDVPLWNVAARFLTPLARYRSYISPELEPEYVDEEMVVLGVNTARSFARGEGRINMDKVERIVRRLAELPPTLIRVIVTHHPFDLPAGVPERRLLGRAYRAMARLAVASADLFLSGHLHLSHASHSAERYRIAGHSALIVQAGTVSLRGRGEQPSFNLVRVARPRIELLKFVWDPAAGSFVETSVGRYRHTAEGWIADDAPTSK